MAFRLWFRRAHGLLFVGMFTVLCVLVVLSRDGWQWQWLWATSWAVGSSIVVAPVLAGSTAFVVQRRLSPSARILTASSRRGVSGVLLLAAVPWSAAVVGIVAGLVVVGTRTSEVAGPPHIPGWIVGHALVAVSTAGLFGLAVGVWVPNLAAGPLAAVLAYVVPIAVLPLGVEGLMAAGGSTGPAYGMEPEPRVLGTMIAVNVALGALCVAVVVGRLRPVRGTWWYLAGALGVLLVTAGATLSTMDPRMSWLRPVEMADECVGDATRVCGPADSVALLETAQRDIAAAREVLSRTGLEADEAYVYSPGPEEAGAGTGVLYAEPQSIVDGHLGDWDVALTIATPAACAEYFHTSPPDELLAGQARLASWVSDALAGRVTQADRDVLTTYDALRACDGTSLPDWASGEW